jgi:hypothetical protein
MIRRAAVVARKDAVQGTVELPSPQFLYEGTHDLMIVSNLLEIRYLMLTSSKIVCTLDLS